ncbi:MAG: mechanosensitive ion channel family protein [Clostridia bacterium]|nr:mechanosensitive ion channel family protein [Clostridia bacterium]
MNNILEKSIGGFNLGTLLSSLIIFLVGVIVIRIATKLTAKALSKSRLEKGLRSFIGSCVKVGLWIVVILVVADKLGIPSATLVAALSVAGLALSLALQNILENVFSGFTILFTKPFVSGDYVEIGTIEGEVVSIRLFYTTIITYDKKKIFVPNSEIVATKVINCTNEPIRRVDRAFGLSYDCPTAKVREALLAAAAADGRILQDPAPEVRLTAYHSSNIEYTLVSWVKSGDYWGVYFDINESVREYINAAGLSMSYDRVDLRITEKK